MKVLLFAGAVPFILSFFPPLKFYSKFKNLILSIMIIVVLFGAWDVWAAFRGHWHFNEAYVFGIKIFNLPLEEILFFVVVPFCCIFTWEAINYIKEKMK